MLGVLVTSDNFLLISWSLLKVHTPACSFSIAVSIAVTVVEPSSRCDR